MTTPEPPELLELAAAEEQAQIRAFFEAFLKALG